MYVPIRMMSICDLVLGLQNQLLSYFALDHDGISHIKLCHCDLDLWLCQIMDLLFYNLGRCRWVFLFESRALSYLVCAVGYAGVSKYKNEVAVTMNTRLYSFSFWSYDFVQGRIFRVHEQWLDILYLYYISMSIKSF